MSERRSVIVPPEITNGSRSGSVSSNSSARAIRVIVIYAEPRQDPETKRDHQEVCALDPVALLQPPYTVGEENDHPEASQQDDDGPANPGLGGIDCAAPGQDSGEREKRQASQATTFVHLLCRSSGQSRAACLRACQSEIQMADGTAATSNPSPTITHRAASATNQPVAANAIPKTISAP